MSNLRTLVFFATPAHDCSYLPDRQATTMFVDPRAKVDKRLYSQLTALGFRRSGSHYYRPHCEDATPACQCGSESVILARTAANGGS